MKLILPLVCMFLLLPNKGYATSDTIPKYIPEGAVRFHNIKNNVVLDGIMNDSISIKALLDIGAWGIAIPENHKIGGFARKDSLNIKEEIRFRVGNWERKQVVSYMKGDSQFLRWYGEECVLLGWDFFDGKIMEISYNGHYIRELKESDLEQLVGYDCIPFMDRGKRLIVPASVKIDGKMIVGNYWIDSGLNGTLFFTNNIPTAYNLDFSKSKVGRAKNMDSNRTKINILTADTLRIGNSVVVDRDIIFSESEWFVFKENDIYIGLIGNQFFSNFSVIFDFRKNNLYLKPIEE